MASIGSISVDTMMGSPTAKGLVTDEYARKGSDRIDRTQVGTRPVPAMIETTTLITGATLAVDADAARKARMALQGTLQTVTDAHGTAHANTMIRIVDPAPARRIIYKGADAIQLRTRWTVEGS